MSGLQILGGGMLLSFVLIMFYFMVRDMGPREGSTAVAATIGITAFVCLGAFLVTGRIS